MARNHMWEFLKDAAPLAPAAGAVLGTAIGIPLLNPVAGGAIGGGIGSLIAGGVGMAADAEETEEQRAELEKAARLQAVNQVLGRWL